MVEVIYVVDLYYITGVPAVVVAIVLASTHNDSAYGQSLYGQDTDGNGDAL